MVILTATCDNKGEYNIIDNCKKCNPTYGNYCPKGSTTEKVHDVLRIVYGL